MSDASKTPGSFPLDERFRLDVAVHAHIIGVFETDPQTGEVYWNSELERIFGYASGEFDGQLTTWRKHVLPEDLRQLEKVFEKTVAQKAPNGSFRYRMRRRDGEIRFIQGSAHFYYDEHGRHTKRVGANLDVTEVVAQEVRWRAIFEEMQEGFVACELVRDESGEPTDFVFLEVNNRWYELTGISREASIGSRAYEVIPDLEPHWLALYSRVVRTGKSETFTARARALNRWFQVHAYRYAEDRFAALFLDVTKQKLLEDDVSKAHRQALRSSRLSAMGAMTSTLAHELNQPLATAVNYLAVIQRSLEDDFNGGSALGSAIKGAQDAVLRAGEIIRRMRNFTRNGQLDRVPERLSAIVNTAAVEALLEPEAADVNLQVELHDDATVMADKIQLHQVFGNLFRNAVTAMAKQSGPKELTVRSRVRGNFVEVKIRDSGPGITEDRVERLFNAFESGTGEGLGLGLALCRTIVEAHQGKIFARPGDSGAVFVVRLPTA